MSELVTYLKQITTNNDLEQDATARIMQIISLGGATPAQIAALLVAFHCKGVSQNELLGFSQFLSRKSLKLLTPPSTINLFYGGNNSQYLDIYGATALVLAGCSVPVLLQLNTANSAGADNGESLKQLGINLYYDQNKLALSLQECCIGIALSSTLHPLLREILEIQNEIGLHTLFNLLLPIIAPSAKFYLIALEHHKLANSLAMTLNSLNCERAWLTKDYLNLDEVNSITEFHQNRISQIELDPKQLKLEPNSTDPIDYRNPMHNAKRLNELLHGKRDNFRTIVLLNAAAALVIVGKTKNISAGLELATKSIDQGAARICLTKLGAISNS